MIISGRTLKAIASGSIASIDGLRSKLKYLEIDPASMPDALANSSKDEYSTFSIALCNQSLASALVVLKGIRKVYPSVIIMSAANQGDCGVNSYFVGGGLVIEFGKIMLLISKIHMIN